MDEIDADLARERPMQRLLMGEVGSGKTVVALHAMLRAVEHGMQAAMMAPTETLAEQHFATLQALMPGSLVPVALLTGSTPAGRRADLLGKLRSGELKLIVGTHALIEETVEFDRLAVAVVDEQHRFGVRQRAALDAKAPEGLAPHVLHMTATPIPRTLRLASFGALDVTALRELPKGRRPIETFVVGGERERDRAYERIREELRAGHQAFVVCPLVSESEVLQARAATAEFERLKETEFADFRVVLLHGQMRPREKAAAMEAFAGGGADVLVATTVIEVGIDVPNATVMVVEDAERYGISQLHQLRGRVGRGQHPSLCLLFGPGDSPRLKALARHGDGFELAAIDLELRGEGELTGTRQSGLARFRFARLPEDAAILERAHARATALLKRRSRPAGARAVPAGRASSRRPRRSPWRREGRGRAPRRPAAARAAGPRHAADLRSRARGAVLDARPARRRPRAGPLRRLGRPGHRGALAGGADGHAGRARRRARSRSSAPTWRRSGSARTRPAWSTRRPARRSATHRRAATHTIWSSSTRRTGTRRRWDGSSRRPCPPCWPPPRGS